MHVPEPKVLRPILSLRERGSPTALAVRGPLRVVSIAASFVHRVEEQLEKENVDAEDRG
jgi:hypothetical protein